MNDPNSNPPQPGNNPDRRAGQERRQRHWHGLWTGHLLRRRQHPRRLDEHHLAVVDWHHPQWLLVSLLVLLLSITDAFFTLTLISRGASEINPLMEPLVGGSGHAFAYWKVGLTTLGILILTAVSRLTLVGPVKVGAMLYLVLVGLRRTGGLRVSPAHGPRDPLNYPR